MMDSEKSFQPKPEKPSVLYHATQVPNIQRFEPRAIKRRADGEGPVVFATPSKAIAATFLFPWSDSWVQLGTIHDEPYIVISDADRFEDVDTGGYMYTLPSDTFETDMEKGMRSLEYTSGEAVEPIDGEFYPSALEAMVREGIKVYFVDQNTFAEIQSAPDDGIEIISKLTPVTL